MRKFPDGWRSVRLDDAATWLSGGTPSTSIAKFWDGEIPWISAASLKSFEINDSERRVTELGARAGTRVVPKDTTLLVVRGMSLKTEVRVGITSREVTFGQDCKAFVAAAGIQPRFLARAIKAQAQRILRMVDEAGHGTGRLPSDQLRKLMIGVPPMREQWRITEILDSVDESIRTTERLIAKLHDQYTGLLVSLISDENAASAPLGDVLSRIDAGKSPDLPDRPAGSGEWGVLKVSAVKAEGLRESENKVVTNGRLISATHEVRDEDVLISRANTPDLVGLACFIQNPRPMLMLSDKTLRLVVRRDLAEPEYVALALSVPSVRRQIEICGTGSSGSMKNISQREIRELQIPLPVLSSQRVALSLLRGHRSKRQMLESEVAKLRSIKHGLMDDLLTGRVRVNTGEGVAA